MIQVQHGVVGQAATVRVTHAKMGWRLSIVWHPDAPPTVEGYGALNQFGRRIFDTWLSTTRYAAPVREVQELLPLDLGLDVPLEVAAEAPVESIEAPAEPLADAEPLQLPYLGYISPRRSPASAVRVRAQLVREAEEHARLEAEERARLEAEEQARQAAEQARLAAEEQARQEALEAAAQAEREAQAAAAALEATLVEAHAQEAAQQLSLDGVAVEAEAGAEEPLAADVAEAPVAPKKGRGKKATPAA